MYLQEEIAARKANQMHTLCAFLAAISSLQIHATPFLGLLPLSEEVRCPESAVQALLFMQCCACSAVRVVLCIQCCECSAMHAVLCIPCSAYHAVHTMLCTQCYIQCSACSVVQAVLCMLCCACCALGGSPAGTDVALEPDLAQLELQVGVIQSHDV